MVSENTVNAQPLLEALQELLAAYKSCVERAEILVGALASADFARIHAAVASQMQALSVVESSEKRRQDAARTLACAIKGQDPCAGGSQSTVTSTALLSLLPPKEAAALAATRHQMLGTLVTLQGLQRQAAVLVRTGEASLRHAAQAVSTAGSDSGASYRPAGPLADTVSATGYGPRGERPRPQWTSVQRQERWA